jgi:predicted O-methyltransferase YrrM
MEFWTAEMEKQVGERVQIMLGDPMLLAVYEKFGVAPFRRSSVFHGLGKFLRQQNVSGECCFEVGTWNGLTAVVLSRFFERVVTVDIAHNALKHEILLHLGVTNVECIDIRDNAHKARIARATKFDFAYLDGDHANDTDSDWALTNGCGRVLFHEVWPFQEPVWRLVNMLPDREVAYGGAGLALWERGK